MNDDFADDGEFDGDDGSEPQTVECPDCGGEATLLDSGVSDIECTCTEAGGCPECGGNAVEVFICGSCGCICDEEGEYLDDGLSDDAERRAEAHQMGL